MLNSCQSLQQCRLLNPTSFGRARTARTHATSETSGIRAVSQSSVADLLKIGSAAVDVLSEQAVELAAEASRAQAEQLKILSKLPNNPALAIGELTEDVASRVISPQEMSSRMTMTVEKIFQRIDDEMSSSSQKEKAETVDENAVPELPDFQEVLDDVRADVAATRATVRRVAPNTEA